MKHALKVCNYMFLHFGYIYINRQIQRQTHAYIPQTVPYILTGRRVRSESHKSTAIYFQQKSATTIPLHT